MASWLSYFCSYLAYQAKRERLTTSHVGRVYRAARALCEEDGSGTGEEAVSACLMSLLRLAVCCQPAILLEAPNPRSPRECTNADLQHDIDVAALYLGRAAHIERLAASGVEFVDRPGGESGLRSAVFGDAIDAAADGGNLELIQLLLSRMPEHHASTATGGIKIAHKRILHRAAQCGHRALFHFALDSMAIPTLLAETAGRPSPIVVSTLGRALCTPWPDNFERVAAIVGAQSNRLNPRRGGDLSSWLARSAAAGKIELVHHFLNEGAVTANNPGREREYTRRPLLSLSRALFRATDKRDEVIVEILLNAGAGVIAPQRPGGLLRVAAWKCSIAIAKMLLERGADPNEGRPPAIVVAVCKEHLDMFFLLRQYGARLDTLETGGWAMAVARQYGLDSMVELLIREGVDKDVVVERVWERKELYYGLG